MDIIIRKIKRDGAKLFFDYIKVEDKKKSEHTAKFMEDARPEFKEAFDKLAASICSVMEIDRSMARRVYPFAVTYSADNKGRMGAVISFDWQVPSAGKVTTVNTPLTHSPLDDLDASHPEFFDSDTASTLWDLQQEAILYLRGHRAQGNLFDEETPKGKGDPINVTPEDVAPAQIAAAAGQAGGVVLQLRG